MGLSQAEKQKWAQKYAARIAEEFIPWQEPLGIDADYHRHLIGELADCCDDPLKKELVEATYTVENKTV